MMLRIFKRDLHNPLNIPVLINNLLVIDTDPDLEFRKWLKHVGIEIEDQRYFYFYTIDWELPTQ